jgi:SAM-dependent methyltransferase
MQAGPAVKKVLKSDGTTGEADASYDAVLSSQVLEHVPRPDAYLRECARILKAGGELILTTHGMFEEHGCPHDFTRWTSKGLEELVSKCGFQIIESCKLTTEMRAAVQLTNQIVLHFRCRERPLIHFVLAAARKIYFAVFAPVLNWFADAFPEQAVVPGSSTNSLYSCIYVRARKL